MRATAIVTAAGCVVAVSFTGATVAPASRQPVRVPAVVGRSLASGYRSLHRVGLKVTIAKPFALSSLADPSVEIVSLTPRAGSSVAPSSTASLMVGCPTCGLASAGVPTGRLPRYRLPYFISEQASTVTRWLKHKDLYLTEEVGPLRAGNAATLFGNFDITGQSPSPGSMLQLGVGHKTGPPSGSFRPTPLVIRLSQRR